MCAADGVAQGLGQELGLGQILLGTLPTRDAEGRPSQDRSVMHRSTIYWFRSDLRLHDNPALLRSAAESQQLSCVYIHDPAQDAEVCHGFRRMGSHRRRFLADGLANLASRLASLGQRLHVLRGRPGAILPALAAATGASHIFCEEIAAPEEQAELEALRRAGLQVESFWQSSLLDPADLPFDIDAMPRVFTAFRQRIEAAGVTPHTTLSAPSTLPPPPSSWPALSQAICLDASSATTSIATFLGADEAAADDPRSAFPLRSAAFAGGESAALQHLAQYFESDLPQHYKQTRNGLIGTTYSTKFSPWLASGALSPRRVFEALRAHERRFGANENTYWIWFELLWRDYFRFLHRQHGSRLYRAAGLSQRSAPPHDPVAFRRWCEGRTGEPFIDAAMKELAATGYLSNRMRQNAASFLVNDLVCDFRAGAAWFESMLIDYDPCSNQGNWLYLAGRGTDPRDGRRFEPLRQAVMYDPDGAYRGLWNASH